MAKALADIRDLLIDMDGVLYRGMAPIPGAKEFIAFARERGIPFLLFTNNSTLTPQQYVAKLAGMGITASTEEIFTSAQATADYLPETISPGSSVFMIGENGLQAALLESGYRLVGEKHADAVVVGMDRYLTYEKLRVATLAIRAGALFIATNPDVTFPSEEGIAPGNGAALAALEVATDTKPLIIGKPEKPMFDLALARLGASRDTTAMIGDRPETDVLGAQRAGLLTIFVLSGVADRQRLAASGLSPDWVFEDLGALHKAWVAQA